MISNKPKIKTKCLWQLIPSNEGFIFSSIYVFNPELQENAIMFAHLSFETIISVWLNKWTCRLSWKLVPSFSYKIWNYYCRFELIIPHFSTLLVDSGHSSTTWSQWQIWYQKCYVLTNNTVSCKSSRYNERKERQKCRVRIIRDLITWTQI